LPETISKIKVTKSNTSEEERARWAKLHTYRSEESKEKSRETLRQFNRARWRPVEITNIFTKEKFIYSSLKEAASGIDVHVGTIRWALKRKSLIKKFYSITDVKAKS
jgi:hypothetical protein